MSPPADRPARHQPAHPDGQEDRWLRTPAGWLMVAAMAAGSVFMWIGIPVGLIYLASRVADSSQPSLGPYLLILLGLPLGMGLVGRLLSILDRRYAAMLGQERRYRPAWTKSMRGERGSTHKWTVLDSVMLWSVLVALLLSAIWFFAFAGSPLPSV